MTNETPTKPYTDLTVTPLENSEIEIRATIPTDIFEKKRVNAVKHISEHISLDGFRKGHVPADVLLKHVGEMTILEEMAELAIADVYPAIVIDNELDVIGRPHVSITKLAAGNPVEFVARTATVPKFELPDYLKIAEKARKPFENAKVEVVDKEIEDSILALRRRMYHFDKYHSDGSNEPHDEHDGNDTPESELPPFDDAAAQKLGDFKTAVDFREFMKKNIAQEKELKEKEKKRLAIVEALVKETKMPLPDVLRNSELDKMMGEFRSEIERMGIEPEQYFEHLKKTPESLREEWKPEAEKRAKLQLILGKIAFKENILLEDDRVTRDVNHVLEHYKDVNPDNVRMYVETMMRNEKVFELLEGKKEEPKTESK